MAKGRANTLLGGQVGKQRDGHDGLAQPHLVGQDAIQAARVESHQPVQSDVLILSQPVLQQERHLQQVQREAVSSTSAKQMRMMNK